MRVDVKKSEYWTEPLRPEAGAPAGARERYTLAHAENLYHLADRVSGTRKGQMVWMGGCVLYRG